MGCTYSGQGGMNDGTGRSFRVHNVDDQGVELNRGTIEIRDSDLVLYQKGKEPIRWPLRCMRRYGFDAELFSFESGRWCATGPGIFAFKCAHAEALFNLVQESIQRAGEQEDQRAQQQPTQISGIHHIPRQVRAIRGETPDQRQQHQTYGAFVSSDGDRLTVDKNSSARRNGGSQLYVNGGMTSDGMHEYVNTGVGHGVSGAFQIDETAALIDFLHNPPGVGGVTGRSQVNYAELYVPEVPASMENLLDETGQGAIHNVERRVISSAESRNRLSQHSLSIGGHGAENVRLSMPNDMMSGAAQDNDSILHSTDSDVFLADAPPDSVASTNYVNLMLEEGAGAAAGAVLLAPVTVPSQLDILPPTHEMLPGTNYANLALQPRRAPKSQNQRNYIVIDHKAQSNDNIPGGNPNNNSPTSPTSCISFPESPSRKTESYARIDLQRTVALSNTTRPVAMEDEGGRKTRHNSTISDMP